MKNWKPVTDIFTQLQVTIYPKEVKERNRKDISESFSLAGYTRYQGMENTNTGLQIYTLFT